MSLLSKLFLLTQTQQREPQTRSLRKHDSPAQPLRVTCPLWCTRGVGPHVLSRFHDPSNIGQRERNFFTLIKATRAIHLYFMVLIPQMLCNAQPLL